MIDIGLGIFQNDLSLTLKLTIQNAQKKSNLDRNHAS